MKLRQHLVSWSAIAAASIAYSQAPDFNQEAVTDDPPEATATMTFSPDPTPTETSSPEPTPTETSSPEPTPTESPTEEPGQGPGQGPGGGGALDPKVRYSWTLTQVKCGGEPSTAIVNPSSNLFISGASNTGTRTWNADRCFHVTTLGGVDTGTGNGSGTITATFSNPTCTSTDFAAFCTPIAALCDNREPTTYQYVVSGEQGKTLTLSADFTDDNFALRPCGLEQNLNNVEFIYTRP